MLIAMAGRADLESDLDVLVARAQEGDARAFERLVASHLGRVRRFARAFAPTTADADDLAQEALIKVYRNLRSFRYQAAFGTWLFAVVRNTMLDHARSAAGRARAREVALGPEHADGAAEGVAPDDRLAAEEDRRHLWSALRRVGLEFRTAVVLFDVEGRTYDEIAAVEGVAVGTVKSRLSRGRAQLRRLLEGGRADAPAPGRVQPAAAGPYRGGVELGTNGGRASSHLPRSRA
jgi:RNA polymerase sigma-70 factor (ECF subfamily)